MSVFAKYEKQAWPYRFAGTLRVHCIAGGTPTDPKVAKGWIETILGREKEDQVRAAVAEVMVERGVSMDEAAQVVNDAKHLNGFKRDAITGELYIEGRHLKAAIKEAASVAQASGKLAGRGWGTTNKGLKSFVAEHICVVEDVLPLGVKEPTGIAQRFVSTFRGTGIQYEEYVEDAHIDFTVMTDHDFSEKDWAMLWLTGQEQGIGASRSQGYGRYEVVKWERQ